MGHLPPEFESPEAGQVLVSKPPSPFVSVPGSGLFPFPTLVPSTSPNGLYILRKSGCRNLYQMNSRAGMMKHGMHTMLMT